MGDERIQAPPPPFGSVAIDLKSPDDDEEK